MLRYGAILFSTEFVISELNLWSYFHGTLRDSLDPRTDLRHDYLGVSLPQDPFKYVSAWTLMYFDIIRINSKDKTYYSFVPLL